MPRVGSGQSLPRRTALWASGALHSVREQALVAVILALVLAAAAHTWGSLVAAEVLRGRLPWSTRRDRSGW